MLESKFKYAPPFNGFTKLILNCNPSIETSVHPEPLSINSDSSANILSNFVFNKLAKSDELHAKTFDVLKATSCLSWVIGRIFKQKDSLVNSSKVIVLISTYISVSVEMLEKNILASSASTELARTEIEINEQRDLSGEAVHRQHSGMLNINHTCNVEINWILLDSNHNNNEFHKTFQIDIDVPFKCYTS
ncbi:hypothetical protein AGLY_014039 [Aphis glycines]|uniref:Uncharacterized protein n=1 Tax=Aphis glycines TaxID=307491 RepID=A0A6G0T4Q8_APHGL|nr:hypothetical protein AGLY_014039 [Aphis glycines]